MSEAQIAREASPPRIELFQVRQDHAGDFSFGNPLGNRSLAVESRRPGVDPGLQNLQLRLARADFLRWRRHFSLQSAQEEIGLVRLSRHHQRPAHQQFSIKNQTEASLVSLPAAVAPGTLPYQYPPNFRAHVP